MKVVGEAKVEKIVEGRPEKVWEQTKSEAGIEEKIYFDYYTEKTNAVAYQLIEIKKYSRPRSISSYGLAAAPQSFAYIALKI